jgi:hypothetical protein
MLLIGICLLIWATLTAKRRVTVQSISPAEMQLPSSGQASQPTILETRQVVLEWPSTIRIGDMAVITLVFEPGKNEPSSDKPQDGFSDVYDKYSLMAEGRFEVAGIRVDPANPTRESMPSGQTVKLKWRVNADKAGEFPGNVWLSLRFLPHDGTETSQTPIFARKVDIHTTSLFGISGPLARLMGGVGIFFSVLVSFDIMIEFVRNLRRKITTKYIKDTKDIK